MNRILSIIIYVFVFHNNFYGQFTKKESFIELPIVRKELKIYGEINFYKDSIVGESLKNKKGSLTFVNVEGKESYYLCADSCCSTVRIKKQSNLMFLIKASQNTADLAEVLNIYKSADTKGKERCFKIISSKDNKDTLTIYNDIGKAYDWLPFNQNDYLINLINLERGEYIISFKMNRNIYFDFSIY